MKERFRGVFPIVNTPFRDDGSIDIESQRRLVRFLIDGGAPLFTAVLPLIRYKLQPGLGVSVMKHNLCDAGIIRSARVRQPTKSLDAAGLDELRELREDLDLFAFRWESGASADRDKQIVLTSSIPSHRTTRPTSTLTPTLP